MNKMKLINDPVYGLIHIRTPLIFDLIEHPLFQRLRRIKQTGLTHLVYPGAQHTRFHHALGAMHLMGMAMDELRIKQVNISLEEEEAALVAVLLHDIGHSPYSHALEGLIIEADHESIGKVIFTHLIDTFNSRIGLAFDMFTGRYPRPFFHQLISGQLDLDRLDYLSRDSFYTGVAEGVVGHDRILRMLQVVNDKLVVEEKGLYSIEKFLVARRIMYWQVYLHKTVLAAELMAQTIIKSLKQLDASQRVGYLTSELAY
ncbi:MAG TPA: HD domain-containing protein, partial [Saprospiraceae bacterium]|nr:HD domain-containing protein [Saprospiraceae bacterium]